MLNQLEFLTKSSQMLTQRLDMQAEKLEKLQNLNNNQLIKKK